MATERSLERCGVDRFDVLLLHNPDRIGYSSEAVWEGMRALREEGLADALGVAPGPANGFTLDVILCLERFAELIDWTMIILGPMEPWPGELVLGAAGAAGAGVITRVVDYGGLFHDDVLPGHAFARHDHRGFRPEGWVEEGRRKLELMRPYAARHGLTMLQLACLWNLGQPGVRCVVPTLIQEAGDGARPVEDKRAELAALDGQGRAPDRGRAARDPRDRGQRRVHDLEGRKQRTRGAGAARPLAPERGARGRGRALGDRSGERPRAARADAGGGLARAPGKAAHEPFARCSSRRPRSSPCSNSPPPRSPRSGARACWCGRRSPRSRCWRARCG